MLYSTSPALYETVRAQLIDAIGESGYFSGSLSFDFDGLLCTLRCSLIVSRRDERLPEGCFRCIADLIPVWWEYHTVDAEGRELLNDFSFDGVRQRV